MKSTLKQSLVTAGIYICATFHGLSAVYIVEHLPTVSPEQAANMDTIPADEAPGRYRKAPGSSLLWNWAAGPRSMQGGSTPTH